MVPGVHGKVLWVDLSSGKSSLEEIPDEMIRHYLGGYGVAEALTAEQQPAGADPLGEDNVLCFSVGLLTGSGAPFSGRFMVSAKSPVTGGVGEANAGGNFGPALRRAGVDVIAVKGCSETPVYLVVKDGKAEIRDASEAWGKDTVQTEAWVKEQVPVKGIQVACIGPAGENRSFMAGVVNDGARIAARMGLGCVMGAKGLKAVACGGSAKVEVYDRDKLLQVNKSFLKVYQRGAFLDKLMLARSSGPLGLLCGVCLSKLGIAMKQNYALMRSLLRTHGTAGFSSFSMLSGDGPSKNWNGSAWQDFTSKQVRRITGDSILSLQKKKYHCAHCPLGCGGELELPEGFRALPGCHKPEYETLASLGSLLLLDDVEPLLAMNDLANRAGIDSISLGGVLGFAAECVERGVLSREELDGVELKWGGGDGFLALAEKIIRREGIGEILADGTRRAAERLGKGSQEYAIHAGGIELPMHDPRNDPGYGVAYQCDAVPGKHSSALTFAELLQVDKVWKEVKGTGMLYGKKRRYDPEYVGRSTALANLMFHLSSCAGLCVFGALTSGASWPLFPWVNACTGWDLSPDEFKELGLRIVNLRWALNRREGIGIKDFGVSKRAKGQPALKRGPNQGVTLDMDSYARHYFNVMGWEYDSGMPNLEKMSALGLPDGILCHFRQEGGAT